MAQTMAARTRNAPAGIHTVHPGSCWAGPEADVMSWNQRSTGMAMGGKRTAPPGEPGGAWGPMGGLARIQMVSIS